MGSTEKDNFHDFTSWQRTATRLVSATCKQIPRCENLPSEEAVWVHRAILNSAPSFPWPCKVAKWQGEAWDKWLDRVHAACAVAVAVREASALSPLDLASLSTPKKKNNACLSFIIFCLKREESPGREQDPKSPRPGIPPFSLSILNRKHSC